MTRFRMETQRYFKSIASCLYLCAGGFLRKRHRPLLDAICTHFDHAVGPKPLVPEISMGELLGGEISLKLAELDATEGNVAEIELLVIAALVRQAEPHLCFEIGTFDGRTTLNMALNLPTDGRVFTLDLPGNDKGSTLLPLDHAEVKYVDKPVPGARFAGHELAGQITQLYGDSASYDFSRFLDSVDFMFVDGSHSYDYAKTDSLTALEMVRSGGIILWHDYDTPYWPGVTRALNELHASHPAFSGLRRIRNTSLCILKR